MNLSREEIAALDPEQLLVCPVCDALHRLEQVPDGTRARCVRCHAVMMAPRSGAMTQIVMLAATALVLMVAAVFFPFLEISAAGFSQRSSVLDAVTAFSDGLFLPLAFAVAMVIVVLPAMRLGALIYVVGPMAIGERPARHARRALRLAEALRPWAMAEIFVVGVAVALVKVAGLARIGLGPAFWALVALVLVVALKDTVMCKVTLWKTLDTRRRS